MEESQEESVDPTIIMCAPSAAPSTPPTAATATTAEGVVADATVVEETPMDSVNKDEQQQQVVGAVMDVDADAITADSDLSRPDRKIWVVTTAALPWRTGTSVNPLARALYLTRGRPKYAVTLMIPFLPDKEEQAKLFGKDVIFETPEEQEEWIREYCKTRVNCPEEAENLRFRFYNSTYNNGFGSIFATVDICALIPDDEADVCILEEPEHMNWMRVVDEDEEETEGKQGASGDESSPSAELTADEKQSREIAQLGWAVKFKHVVGIIHTNYDAYVRHYGMGTAFLAASALQALSALVTRAYCHKVIRLSDTLPSLDRTKEVTCNVHGVRSEFLDPPEPSEENNDTSLAPIYFIGKLIWAKGFDKMLDIEELYKKKTGAYFPIDIYGSGPNEQAIKRAFFGRKGILDTSHREEGSPPRELTPDRLAKGFFETAGSLRDQLLGKKEQQQPKEEEKEEVPSSPEVLPEPIEVVWDETTPLDGSNAQIVPTEALPETEFPNPFVILSDLSGEFMGCGSLATMAGVKVGSDIVGLGVNAFASSDSTSGSSNNEDNSSTSEGSQSDEETSTQDNKATEVPTEDAQADANDTMPSEKEAEPSGSEPVSTKHHKKHGKRHRGLRFDPPKSRYELRRYPAPARFLGLKDHAVLRDLTRHKIFFNPSESEVLCTTSAEALAMGKFVILPKHPSNTFFEQFSNCLTYETKEECVAMIQWAIANDPAPLSELEHFQLTWEGANDRLYKAAAMTEAEVKAWHDSGRAQSDKDAARLHYETVKRGRGVQKLLHRI